MRKIIIVGLTALMAAGAAEARNDKLNFPISGALTHPKAKDALLPNVALYFGDQPVPAQAPSNRTLEITTSRKTNAFGKSDEAACQWAMLSALKALQERAAREGANAVINIKSNYEHQEFSSTTEYQCGAGALMAGVALKGTVVTLQK